MWDHVSPHLIEAIQHTATGMISLADVRELLEQGRWHLWIIVAPGRVVGVATCFVEDFPLGRQMFITLAAGEDGAAAVEAAWPEVKAIAAAMECDEVRFFGRRGWWRSGMLPAGARHVADVIALRVED